jgi:hypothetical protein
MTPRFYWRQKCTTLQTARTKFHHSLVFPCSGLSGSNRLFAITAQSGNKIVLSLGNRPINSTIIRVGLQDIEREKSSQSCFYMERWGFRNEHIAITTSITAHVNLLKPTAVKTEAFCHHWNIFTVQTAS